MGALGGVDIYMFTWQAERQAKEAMQYRRDQRLVDYREKANAMHAHAGTGCADVRQSRRDVELCCAHKRNVEKVK